MNQLNSINYVPVVYNEKLDVIPICGHLQLDIAVDESCLNVHLQLVVALRGLLGERCFENDSELAFLIASDESDPQTDGLRLEGEMLVYTSWEFDPLSP